MKVATPQGALPRGSAWANAHRLVLGPRQVADNSNAITALPKLLKLLALEGALVTIDAMRCHKEMAQPMAEQGADDVLALQDNQPTRQGEVHLLVEALKADRLVLAVSFREDDCRMYQGHGAQHMTVLRHLALKLL
jgi:predicted transposase YbfD/YdcC